MALAVWKVFLKYIPSMSHILKYNIQACSIDLKITLESNCDLLNGNYSSWLYLENGLIEKQDRMPVSLCAGALSLPWFLFTPRFWDKCLCKHRTAFPCFWLFMWRSIMIYACRPAMHHKIKGAPCSAHGLDLWVAREFLTSSHFKCTENNFRVILFGLSQKAVQLGLILTLTFKYLW